jgi:hypothetical protein
MVAEISEKCLLILQREMDFTWGEKLYVECCVRKERNGVAWLVAGVWKLKGIRKNRDKRRCLPCLGEVCQIFVAGLCVH